jgi:hypothetical protein
MGLEQLGEVFANDVAPGRTKYVADEEDIHQVEGSRWAGGVPAAGGRLVSLRLYPKEAAMDVTLDFWTFGN